MVALPPTNQRPRLPMMMPARQSPLQGPLHAVVVDAAFIITPVSDHPAAAAPVVDGADRGVKHSAFACVRAHACTHPIHSHHPSQT